MRILIIESDFTFHRKVKKIFTIFGKCHIVVNSREAAEAYRMSWNECKPFDLILINTVRSNMEETQLLKELREVEREMDIEEPEGINVILTITLDGLKALHKKYMGEENTSYLFKAPGDQGQIEFTCMLNLTR